MLKRQAYVHDYMTKMVSHCNYHADYADTHTHTVGNTAERPISLSHHSLLLFSLSIPSFLSAVFPVDRAPSMLTQLELFAFLFPPLFLSDFVPLSSTEINSPSPCWLCIPPSILDARSLAAAVWQPVTGWQELKRQVFKINHDSVI